MTTYINMDGSHKLILSKKFKLHKNYIILEKFDIMYKIFKHIYYMLFRKSYFFNNRIKKNREILLKPG